jgi:hypothetical protein
MTITEPQPDPADTEVTVEVTDPAAEEKAEATEATDEAEAIAAEAADKVGPIATTEETDPDRPAEG